MPTRSADGEGGENLAHGAESLSWVWGGGVVVGEGQEAAREGVAAGRVAPDDQHGVVTGDGAEDVAELGLVERGGQELGGTGGRAEHDQVGARLRADQQLAQQAGHPVRGGGALPRRRRSSVAALGGDGVDQRAGGGPDLDGVELDEVAGERRLGDVEAAAGQQVGELALGPDLVARDQLGDRVVPGVLGGRAHARCSSRLLLAAR